MFFFPPFPSALYPFRKTTAKRAAAKLRFCGNPFAMA